MTRKKRRGLKIALIAAVCLAALAVGYYLLQFVFPHRHHVFSPDYEKADLRPVLAREILRDADYQLLFDQTGLGPSAIDDLRAMGEDGVAQILATQDAFFLPAGEIVCAPLGPITQEHRYFNEDGTYRSVTPLAPLKEGDILLAFSTHTFGWTHGHAGLVLYPDQGITAEAVVLGSLSSYTDIQHWSSYSTLLVLRPTGVNDAVRREVAAFAQERLIGIPYSLVSGVFTEKWPDPEGPLTAQCSYLPWYAWMSQGVDLDSDGGKIVTVDDIAGSGRMEVVQLRGLDPADYPILPR